MSITDSGVSVDTIINQNAVIQKLDIATHQGNKRFIAGYANIADIVDSQNDVVTLDALKKAWAKWRQNPEFCILSLLHSNIPLAKVIFEEVVDTKGNVHKSGVDERGLYLVSQVRDDISVSDEVWRKIENGEFRGYSIGGKNLRPGQQECNGSFCVNKITDLELYEVGIVDKPANEVSLFNILKRDDLAKLNEATKHLTEQVVVEGLLKISKNPCPDSGHYHVVIGTQDESLRGHLSKMFDDDERFLVIDKQKEDEDYVSYYDLALLRPSPVITEEEQHGGFNSPLLPDEPKTEGETPLSKEEDVRETEVDESQIDDSEIPKDQETKADEEEAIAPMTVEVLAAELKRLSQIVEEIKMGKTPKEEPRDCEDEVGKIEKSVEPAKPDAPVEPKVQEAPPVEPPPVPEPPVETPVEPVKETPTVEPPKPVVTEPVTPPEIETRGVSAQALDPQPTLDLASLYRMPWKNIQEGMKKN